MGTNIYGSYDELVIELRGLDRWLSGRAEVRVKVGDVWQVRSADLRTLVPWGGERVFRAGRGGRGTVVVLDLAPQAAFDRLVVAVPDADAVVADLHRCGIGDQLAVA